MRRNCWKFALASGLSIVSVAASCAAQDNELILLVDQSRHPLAVFKGLSNNRQACEGVLKNSSRAERESTSCKSEDELYPQPEIPNIGASIDIMDMRRQPADFPDVLRTACVGGIATLIVTVDPQGGVAGVDIESSSGVDALDESAVRAARTWRYNPASEAGVPAVGRVRVPVEFDPVRKTSR